MIHWIKKEWGPLLFLTGVFAWFFGPLIWGGSSIFIRDTGFIIYPLKYEVARSFHEGYLPFWTNGSFNGQPFLATMLPGVFYPLNVFFLLRDVPTAFNLFCLFHSALLVFSTYALTRHWGLSRPAALCSAVSALLGGYFLSMTSSYLLYQAATWLPLIFLLFQKYLETGKAGYFLATVLCLTAQTLGGSPEHSVYTVGIIWLASLFWLPGGLERGQALRRTAALGSVILLNLGLAAVQLLPTFYFWLLSTRESGLGYENHAMWSLAPAALGRFVLPEDFTNFMVGMKPIRWQLVPDFYMGLVPVLGLCAVLLNWKKTSCRFFVALFFLGVFFALGEFNPVYEYFYRLFPIVGVFRYPEKYLFVCAFSLVFLVGLALDEFTRGGPGGGSKPLWGYGALAAVAAGMGILSFWGARDLLWQQLALVAALAAGLFLWRKGTLKSSGFRYLAVFVVFLDLALKHVPLVPMIDKDFYSQPPRFAERINHDPGLYRVYTGKITGSRIEKNIFPRGGNYLLSHIEMKEELYPYLGNVFGISFPDGLFYLSLESADHSLWTNVFKASPPDKKLRILKRSNVKYWIVGDTLQELKGVFPIADLDKLKVFEDALPRAFLAGRARQGREPYLLNTYYDAAFDPLKEVLLSEPVDYSPRGDFSGTVKEIRYGPNRVTLLCEQNGDGFLVLLDSWFPGWRVTVDGRPGRILRANHFFRAVPLGPGTHTVEYEFEAEGFRTGGMITGLTAVLLAGLIGFPSGRTLLRRLKMEDLPMEKK